MLCPYCEVEISESAVEAEDGYCPECGVFLSASSVFDFEEDDDFDDEEMEDFDFDFAGKNKPDKNLGEDFDLGESDEEPESLYG